MWFSTRFVLFKRAEIIKMMRTVFGASHFVSFQGWTPTSQFWRNVGTIFALYARVASAFHLIRFFRLFFWPNPKRTKVSRIIVITAILQERKVTPPKLPPLSLHEDRQGCSHLRGKGGPGDLKILDISIIDCKDPKKIQRVFGHIFHWIN